MNDPSDLSTGEREYLLAFADDEHLVGSRHAEWIGTAPFLEEDLSFCSIAQDELGHAIALYDFLTDDLDRFALLRAPEEYRSCVLAEASCAPWDEALVRHWLYDEAESLRWAALETSRLAGLAALARRVEREEAFHLEHSRSLIRRMLHGPETARATIVDALVRLLPIAQSVWDPVEGEADALASGLCSMSSRQLGEAWSGAINALLADCAVPPSEVAAAEPSGASGSSRLRRSDGFAAYLARLQEVISIEPTATW
ncbi:MAG: 1,2-phenylacetyl-CoA epoxidase subunit PaaC [Ilumatobacteraceae bacterium]